MFLRKFYGVRNPKSLSKPLGKFKEIDIIADEIGHALVMNPDDVNLSQVTGGWVADVNNHGLTLSGEVCDNPLSAMESLLAKASADA